MKRGDVVIFHFPYKGAGGKVRPALIVQDDHGNARLSATVVVQITGNLKHRGKPTSVFVDPSDADGATSGLHHPSVVNCTHFYTVDKKDIHGNIGRLTKSLMDQVDLSLKASLGLM